MNHLVQGARHSRFSLVCPGARQTDFERHVRRGTPKWETHFIGLTPSGSALVRRGLLSYHFSVEKGVSVLLIGQGPDSRTPSQAKWPSDDSAMPVAGSTLFLAI